MVFFPPIHTLRGMCIGGKKSDEKVIIGAIAKEKHSHCRPKRTLFKKSVSDRTMFCSLLVQVWL